SREQALERARRALDETVIEGIATVLPFHRAVVRDPAFTDEPFRVHTRWIETEFDNRIPPYAGVAAPAADEARQTVVVEVGGPRLDALAAAPPLPAPPPPPAPPPHPARRAGPPGAGSGASPGGEAVVCPMQGTIVKIVVAD